MSKFKLKVLKLVPGENPCNVCELGDPGCWSPCKERIEYMGYDECAGEEELYPTRACEEVCNIEYDPDSVECQECREVAVAVHDEPSTIHPAKEYFEASD